MEAALLSVAHRTCVEKKHHLHFLAFLLRSIPGTGVILNDERIRKSASGCNHPLLISHGMSVNLTTVVAGAPDCRSTASQPPEHKIDQITSITFHSVASYPTHGGGGVSTAVCIPAPAMNGELFGHNLLTLTMRPNHDHVVGP